MKHKYIISNMLVNEVNKLFQKENVEYTLDNSPIPLHSIIETDLSPDDMFLLFQSKTPLRAAYKNACIPVVKDLNKTCGEITHLMLVNRAKFIILED